MRKTSTFFIFVPKIKILNLNHWILFSIENFSIIFFLICWTSFKTFSRIVFYMDMTIWVYYYQNPYFPFQIIVWMKALNVNFDSSFSFKIFKFVFVNWFIWNLRIYSFIFKFVRIERIYLESLCILWIISYNDKGSFEKIFLVFNLYFFYYLTERNFTNAS